MEGEELTETELGRNKPTASQFVPQAGLGLGIGCLSVHEEIQSPVMSFRFFFWSCSFSTLCYTWYWAKTTNITSPSTSLAR